VLVVELAFNRIATNDVRDYEQNHGGPAMKITKMLVHTGALLFPMGIRHCG